MQDELTTEMHWEFMEGEMTRETDTIYDWVIFMKYQAL